MKLATIYPNEKMAYGVVGDAIVVIPIIKGATGVIKQAREWVVVGKDIAGGVKKVFTKPDTGGYIENAYIEAMSGGKHNVWAQQYLNKPSQELQKGIKSFEKQIELHKNKIKDPAKYNPGWDDFHTDRKESLMKRWPKDIERHKEQKAILEAILKTRGN